VNTRGKKKEKRDEETTIETQLTNERKEEWTRKIMAKHKLKYISITWHPVGFSKKR